MSDDKTQQRQDRGRKRPMSEETREKLRTRGREQYERWLAAKSAAAASRPAAPSEGSRPAASPSAASSPPSPASSSAADNRGLTDTPEEAAEPPARDDRADAPILGARSDLPAAPPEREAARPIRDSRYGLDPETVAQLRAEGRKRVEAEERRLGAAAEDRAKARYLDDFVLELRRERGLANHLDDIVEHTITVAPFADRITIDGVSYYNGYTYRLPRRVYNDIIETEARGWDAEDRAGNPHKKFYQRDYGRRGGLTQNPFGYHQQFADGSMAHRISGVNGRTGGVANAPTDNMIDDVIGQVRRL